MCHNLPRIGYKMPYNKVYTKGEVFNDYSKGKTLIQEFVDYVDSFYGQNDPLYPMMSQETNLLLRWIQRATENYLDVS